MNGKRVVDAACTGRVRVRSLAEILRIAAVAVVALASIAALAGCSASYEGTGSKDAASAEQLALRIDDPWDVDIVVDDQAVSDLDLADGVYTGSAAGADGMIEVTLSITDNHIACLKITQEGETQSRGGYEAIRDGTYARMIEAAQGSDIDTISGATLTSAAVRLAVDDALEQAQEAYKVAAAAAASAAEDENEGEDAEAAEDENEGEGAEAAADEIEGAPEEENELSGDAATSESEE